MKIEIFTKINRKIIKTNKAHYWFISINIKNWNQLIYLEEHILIIYLIFYTFIWENYLSKLMWTTIIFYSKWETEKKSVIHFFPY